MLWILSPLLEQAKKTGKTILLYSEIVTRCMIAATLGMLWFGKFDGMYIYGVPAADILAVVLFLWAVIPLIVWMAM